jgi:REP element-mobilizing transposase RayT
MNHAPRPRGDAPGHWHHVMNRGLSHRPVFENRRDLRLFLSLLARKVREGSIEVHAFALLTTHFHLLVRSPRGELSNVMMWVENQYVRRFNRRHGRDGPLFRGRFTSRLVDSEAYWFTLVRYIDRNAVDAGVVDSPQDYPFCSAWHYARRRGPLWLARGEVERAVVAASGSREFRTTDYAACFGEAPRESERWMIERPVERGPRFERFDTRWDDLVASAPERVRVELIERLRAADGRKARAPLIDPATAIRLVDRERARRPDWHVGAGRNRTNHGWHVAAVGLLRDACALTLAESAQRLAIDARAAVRAGARHRHLIASDSSYSERFADLVASIIADLRKRDPRYARCSTTDGNEAGSE